MNPIHLGRMAGWPGQQAAAHGDRLAAPAFFLLPLIIPRFWDVVQFISLEG